MSISYAITGSPPRISTLRVMHSNPHGRPGNQLLGHSWTLYPRIPFSDSLHILQRTAKFCVDRELHRFRNSWALQSKSRSCMGRVRWEQQWTTHDSGFWLFLDNFSSYIFGD